VPADEPGITIDEIVVGDERDAWEAAGFHVDDDGTCRVGRVRIRLVGRENGKRIHSWSLRDLDAGPVDDTIDGLATTESVAPPCEPASHPNGSLFIDHVVLITPDCDRTIRSFEGIGLDVRRVRHTDTYGFPARQTFFRTGEVLLELIGPDEPQGDGPAAFFGLAHTVSDLDATAALLGEHLGDRKDAIQPGRRIATLRHRDLGVSVATAFMSPEPE
jgi:catechol 2,3-dioxygenase-like lactoylglutathione lyase family enzyme